MLFARELVVLPLSIPGTPGPAGPSERGVSYTRWGRTTCPNTQGTQLMYAGVVVGSWFREGGSSEYLCLHNQPQFLSTTSGLQNRRSRLYGDEYLALENPLDFSNMAHHDAPCSVLFACEASRGTAKTCFY